MWKLVGIHWNVVYSFLLKLFFEIIVMCSVSWYMSLFWGIVFLIYLIPGLPKDIMSYAAGISSMNFKAFLIFSMIGRTPAMSGSLLIGALYFSGHYGMMIAIGVFAVAAFVLCIVFRKKISNYIDKLYEKVTED